MQLHTAPVTTTTTAPFTVVTPRTPGSDVADANQPIADALAIQLATEAPTIDRVLNPTAGPALALPTGTDQTLVDAFTAVSQVSRKAEAPEILSRITLKIRLATMRRPKSFKGDFTKKQAKLNALPTTLLNIVDAADADTLNQLFAVGGQDYATAVAARYAAVDTLRSAYHEHAVTLEHIQAYLVHSADDEQAKTTIMDRLAALTIRGDFLLGRMTEGDGEAPRFKVSEMIRQGYLTPTSTPEEKQTFTQRLGTHPMVGNMTWRVVKPKTKALLSMK